MPNKKASAAGGAGGCPTSKRRRQSVEYLVSQKLRDNFKTFQSEETDIIKGPEGRTLREHLTHLMQKELAGETISWGKGLYSQLKTLYKKENMEGAALDLPLGHDAELVQPALLKARSLCTETLSTVATSLHSYARAIKESKADADISSKFSGSPP